MEWADWPAIEGLAFGLIINERIANALKHAFPGERAGEIVIALRSGQGRVSLTVGDNGIGFPAELDFRKTDSLGLQVVTMLTEQLEGAIKLDRSRGTEFRITFPEK